LTQIWLIKACLIFIFMASSILLTGSNGFLGSYIWEKFQNFSVKSLNRERSHYNIDLSKNIPCFKECFDLVIHCAGMAHFVPLNESEAKIFFDINVNGTLNLLAGLQNNCIPRHFVFISSVSVYGINSGVNIEEDFPLLANDPYGRSKIEAEEIVRNWCIEHNVVCTILRLPLVVGPNPPGNLGAMIRAIRKGYYFNISGGKAMKSMVLASDIAKYILDAAEVGGIYNLTDGIHPSFDELSKSISKNLDKSFVPNMPLFIAKVLANIGDKLSDVFPINSNKLSKITSTLTFDDSKARKAFNWDPTPVLIGIKINE
jgi:nucleoside-diphosphate-sugar epimerase